MLLSRLAQLVDSIEILFENGSWMFLEKFGFLLVRMQRVGLFGFGFLGAAQCWQIPPLDE
jgi:hypothetical protein